MRMENIIQFINVECIQCLFGMEFEPRNENCMKTVLVRSKLNSNVIS